jgi:hypothetical protein
MVDSELRELPSARLLLLARLRFDLFMLNLLLSFGVQGFNVRRPSALQRFGSWSRRSDQRQICSSSCSALDA